MGMEEMENVRRCEKSGRCLFEIAIPEDLQELVGKRSVRRVIEVKGEDGIRRMSARYREEYEELFGQLRGGKDMTIDAGIISYLLYCLRDQL